MSKDKYYQCVVTSNDDVEAIILISLYGYRIGDYDNQYIVTNITFEEIIPSIKNNFVHQRMIDLE